MVTNAKTFATVKSGGRSKLLPSGNLAGLLQTSEYSPRGQGAGITPVSDHESIFPLGKFDLQKEKLRWGGDWLDHHSFKFKHLIGAGPPYYSYQHIYDDHVLTDMEKAELIRFLLTLELWETTPGEKKISAFEVWAKSLLFGPKFAEELSDLFAISWRENEIDSYNFVFPARFLPRWKEGVDDLVLSAEETSSFPETLDDFESVLDELLQEVVQLDSQICLPSDKEILFERSTTTSYLSSEERKLPHWEASFLTEKFNEQELVGLRCVVPVYPGGTRDTIIADKTANNSIRWIERAMRHILQYVPESAVTLNSTTFERRLEDVVNTKGHHILRDIKKCGLTYNTHDLFPIVRRQLEKHIPDYRWRRFNIYSNMIILDDNTQYVAKRGYGLGMANHTVTLCNIVIHRMSRNMLQRRFKDTKFSLKSIVGNDDEDVVIYKTTRSSEIAQEYLEIEHTIHGALGNLTNLKKSVIKPYGLFYETYNKDGWREKEALVCNAIACAYLAPSIRVAKHYIYSQSERFTSLWARRRLRALAQYWGEEFFDFKVELRINFEVGGWLNTTRMGLKTSLVDIERLNRRYSTRLISFAVNTCYEFLTAPKPLFKEKGWVENFAYSGPSKKVDQKIQLYTLVDKDLQVYYKKLTKFQRNYSSRIDKFQSRVHFKSIKEDLKSIQLKLMKTAPWYQIPFNLVKSTDNWGSTVSLDYRHEFSKLSDNPIKDLLGAISGTIDPQEVEDQNFRWDPKVPPEAMDYIVKCDLVHAYTASQFSNGGFLPLLDYFDREDQIPICFIIGRTRIAPIPTEREKSISLLSRFKNKPKEKDKKNPTGVEAPEGYIDSGMSLEQILAQVQKSDGSLISSFLDERGVRGPQVNTQDSEANDIRLARLDRLSRFAEGFQDRLGMGAYIEELYGPQETIDIFDGSDDAGSDMFAMFD